MSFLDWKVGDRVVCIDANFPGFIWGEAIPVEGVVYTIREIFTCEDRIALRLVEINNTPRGYRHGFLEAGFRATRFRPVQKRATDISIFTALLTPSEDDIIEIELLDFELERQFQ